jgi:ATPase
MERIVVDTSILIDGYISKNLEKFKDLKEIIVPVAVLDELQNQASKGKKIGFEGLEEIKRLREKFAITFFGERPSLEDVKLAKSGRIDTIIRDVAKKLNLPLITSDYVQAIVGEAEGIKVIYIKPEVKEPSFLKYFDNQTMSVHLKENCYPYAKKGKPGKFELVKLEDRKITKEELEEMIKEIIEFTRKDENSSFEIVKESALVIQMRDYRIAIAKPPFSDGIEITIVKPIVKLSLEDYNISQKLLKRFEEKAEGIIICGPPGSGKSTFCASLVEFYLRKGKIVKTLESPRDLMVPEEVTQYTKLEGSFEKVVDILLLVRPDYTAFDEIRTTKDFEVFADLRLAGIGMIGVVHASSPLDAIQRFLTRYELGMLPHIVDTIIFIKEGEIKKVYTLEIKVKVPTGMTEQDLARPVVEVRDFETGKLEYEIYSYGEENVVVPIKEEKENPLLKLAKERILQIVRKYDENAQIEFLNDNKILLKVDNEKIPKIIGREGKNIKKLEEKLGLSIDVEPKIPILGKRIDFIISEIGNSIEIKFLEKVALKNVKFYHNNEFLFSAIVGKNNTIKIDKDSEIGKKLIRLITKGEKIEAFV